MDKSSQAQNPPPPNPVRLNSIEVYADAGTKAGLASKRRDAACVSFHSDWAKRAICLEAPEYRQAARKAFDDAYREQATPPISNLA